jgi:hypothetical protein
MPPELQHTVDVARVLTPSEQLEFLNVVSDLIQQSSSLEALSQEFWQTHPPKTLLEQQQPPVVCELESLRLDCSNKSRRDVLTSLL